VILDGENCWESYADDGRPFLEALYGRLSEDSTIDAVTVGEALDRVPPTEALSRVPVGSWIAEDLSIWVGHAEKNRAWAELRRLRDRFQSAADEGTLPVVRLGLAREELLAAEASDWFWWYGDDHQSAHKDEFDLLFRSHVIRAYNLLGLPAPATVRRTLRGAAPESAVEERVPFLAPTLDGRDTHFYEWRNAELYDAASDQGAEHRTKSTLRRVLFGLNDRDLFVRVDVAMSAAKPPAAIRLRFTLPRAVEARIPLGGDARGALEWIAGAESGPGGEYAADTLVEIRVPLVRLSAGSGMELRWSVALEEAGEVVEVLPRAGQITIPTLDADFAVRNWSAT
jgi:hypothetical protein